MGVSGLTTFIRGEEQVLDRNHRLHNTKLIIDANNLTRCLIENCKKIENSELLLLDFVAMGKQVELFIDNLRKCEIEPVFAFDGAQTKDSVTSKTDKKLKRNMSRLEAVYNQLYTDKETELVMPALVNKIGKAVAIEKGVKVIQCFYEADEQVAELANELDCPVLTDDSDFFILDLKKGFVSVQSLNYLCPKTMDEEKSTDQPSKRTHYIGCSFYHLDNLIRVLPGFDKRSLPLLAILLGNDIVETKYRYLTYRIPEAAVHGKDRLTSQKLSELEGRKRLVLKTLCFLSGKSLEESLYNIQNYVPFHKRADLWKDLQRDAQYYSYKSADFYQELSKHYKNGYKKTFADQISDPEKLKESCEKEMRFIFNWLKEKHETSDLTKNCLDLALRNPMMIRPELENFDRPSAHRCARRFFSVLLTLMRSHHEDMNPCPAYIRVGTQLEEELLHPILELENYGSIDLLIYDIPRLPEVDRRNILLATYHSSAQMFAEEMTRLNDWFGEDTAEEFFVIKMLLRYIGKEGDKELPPSFRQTTLLCFLFYLVKDNRDQIFIDKCRDEDCMDFLQTLSERYRLECPVARFSINLDSVHHICGIQTAVQNYNELNSFLGNALRRVGITQWLNSCFLYNLDQRINDLRLKAELRDLLEDDE